MPYSSSPRRIYIGVFFILALLIGLHYVGWLRPVEDFLYHLFVPASTGVHKFSVKVGDEYQFFSNKDEVLKKYADCSIALNKQQISAVQNKLLQEENDELKKQLHFTQGQKTTITLAEVVGREIAGSEKTIIINIGNNSSISIGQPVISGEGILIGKIVRVEDKVAMVRLISDPSSKIEAGVINSDHSIGVVEGGYGITLKMKFVPRNEVVKVDDQIITSGYESLIPRGLIVGKVAEVQNQANQGFQDISVIPLVDLNKLTEVSVLVTSK